MTVLVEIVCSVSQEEFAQAVVEAFCKATGGLLIGRRVIEETHKVLLMIRLPQTASGSNHATALDQARQQNVIESFRHVTCDLVQISFDPAVNLREQMRNFPLRPDESCPVRVAPERRSENALFARCAFTCLRCTVSAEERETESSSRGLER